MTVAELIEKLKSMPLHYDVRYLYDGAARGEIEKLWISNGGEVVLAESQDTAYYPNDQPRYQQSPKVGDDA